MTENENPNSNVLICDYGSYKMKVGTNANEAPKSLFHTLIGKAKYKKCFEQAFTKDVVSPNVKSLSLFRTEFPVKRGVIVDPDNWHLLIEKTMIDLKMSGLNDTTVFILEPLNTSLSQKRMQSDFFFEKMNCPYLVFGNQPILSLYSIGQTRGMVIETGHGLTQIACVYDGYKIDDSYQSVHFGGEDVTQHLKSTMQRFGYISKNQLSDHFYNKIKKDICRVRKDPKSKLNVDEEIPSIKYKLPDNTEIEMDSEIQLIPEILFDPKNRLNSQKSLQDTVQNALDKVDPFIRAKLYEQILVSGGNSLIPNFIKRLKMEIRVKANPINKVKVKQHKEVLLSPWIGASLMTNMSVFSRSTITYAEYKDAGDRVLYEKTI